jgi:alkylated DNA repair dioxygenase AlkB
MFPQELPQGLELKANYITLAKEQELIAIIDSLPWLSDLKRRVQHYGFKYDYKVRGNLQKLGELPEFLKKIDVGFPFNQVIINEYEAGQGIAPHIDLPFVFGGVIASLSLGSPAVMEFTKGSSKIPIILPQRSLLAMQKEARYEWKHSIPARKSDNGIPRLRRISLTFRNVA